MTKYRVGDEVTVRGVIDRIDIKDTELPLGISVETGKYPVPFG